MHVPAGMPHGFTVLSDTARMLSLTCGGFEAAVRQVSRPAAADAPPAQWTPSPEERAAFAGAFAANGISLLPPPM